MSYCPNCGKPVDAADNFCRSCGQALKGGTVGNQAESMQWEYCTTTWEREIVEISKGTFWRPSKTEFYWLFFATAVGPHGTYIVPTAEYKVQWVLNGIDETQDSQTSYDSDGDAYTAYYPRGPLCEKSVNGLMAELSSQGWLLLPDSSGLFVHKFRRQVKS